MSNDPLKAIRLAAKRRDRADKARRAAVADLREHVRAAQEAGVPITRIAAEAGLSRQGVYDLLAAGPPS
jgi:DNA invertase Pin-like site-specific DNA recombinase